MGVQVSGVPVDNVGQPVSDEPIALPDEHEELDARLAALFGGPGGGFGPGLGRLGTIGIVELPQSSPLAGIQDRGLAQFPTTPLPTSPLANATIGTAVLPNATTPPPLNNAPPPDTTLLDKTTVGIVELPQSSPLAGIQDRGLAQFPTTPLPTSPLANATIGTAVLPNATTPPPLNNAPPPDTTLLDKTTIGTVVQPDSGEISSTLRPPPISIGTAVLPNATTPPPLNNAPPPDTTVLDATTPPDTTTLPADTPPANEPPTFGEAARTLDAWMKTTPSMQGKAITLDDLNDIANGTGVGAGASDEMKAAAQSLISDGGAQWKATMGGKDGKASGGDISKYVANDTSTPLTDDQISTVSVLDRHQDALKGKMDDDNLQKIIDDPKTPSDLKDAVQKLKDDPVLRDMVDAGKNGKVDGKFSGQDIHDLVAKRPEIVAYNQQQAATFVDNYIPSDDTDKDAKPREMTSNDAMRELYRYSDYLPKNISQQSLQDIVDGTGGEGKAPPQVIAAAQYYLNHPSDWQTIAGTGNSISRGHMEDAISKNVSLTQDEDDAMQTISDNKSTFFSGNLTRDKLTTIANDPNSSDDVKKAANQLLNDPMLFGMLDNGKKGSSGNLIYAADDGKISSGDFDAFIKKSKTYGQPPAPVPPTHEPTSPEDVSATNAMEAGTEDQPEQKKPKGGQFMKFLQGILHVFSKVLDVIGDVLSVFAKIPIIGPIFAGLSVGAKVVSSQAEVGSKVIGGESVGDAEKEAGIQIAGGVIGAIALPGSGALLAKGAEVGAEAGLKAGTKEAVEAGAEKSITPAAIKEATGDSIKDQGKDELEDQTQQEVQEKYDEHRNAVPA